MNLVRSILATSLMFFAVIFKVACISVAPKHLKEQFKDNI